MSSATLSVDVGLDQSQIGWLSLAGAVLSATGCVVGGALSDRIGRRRALAIYAVLTAVPVALLGLYFLHRGWGTPATLAGAGRPPVPREVVVAFLVASLAFSLAQGLIYGTRTALFMDLCDPAVAATQFTAYMALLNLVISYSAPWQGLRDRLPRLPDDAADRRGPRAGQPGDPAAGRPPAGIARRAAGAV